MKRSWKHYVFVLCCLGCLIGSSTSALARGGDSAPEGLPEVLTPSHLLLSGAEAREAALPDALPTRLDAWTEDPQGFNDYSLLTLSALPQGHLSQEAPFIDFRHAAFGAFVGLVTYSADFKANENIVGGLTARVPVPGLPGDWGLFGQLSVGAINRDLPFFYPHQSGTWYGGTIGPDYTLTNGEVLVLRAQAGISYAYWNGVQSLDNGFGGTAGLDFGFYWIRHNRSATVNINPQITFSGGNYYAFLTLGFQVDF